MSVTNSSTKSSITSTSLHLRNLAISLVLAADSWSRPGKAQPALISMKLTLPSTPAATRTDKVDDTFSYSAVHSALSTLSGRNFVTIRGAGAAIADLASHGHWPILSMDLEIRLPKGILAATDGLIYSKQCGYAQTSGLAEQWSVRGLRATCLIGVNEHEMATKQDVIIDLSVRLYEQSLREPLWQRLANCVRESVVEKSGFKTVEALAAMVGSVVLDRYGEVKSVIVKIEKPSAYAFVEGVGCEIIMEKE